MSDCKSNIEHDFESNDESEYCANGCGEKWSLFTIKQLRKELETTNKENARLREALESIERDAWETMKEDIEKIARQALKGSE